MLIQCYFTIKIDHKTVDEPMDDLDEWTTAEKLALAIFVKREGSQNW